MRARSSEYWRQRFLDMEEEQYWKSDSCCQDIAEYYRSAIRETQRDIEIWYQRMADNNGVSLASARKLLKADELDEFHWNVQQYIKRGKENAVDQKWLVELENASAKYHISRLEALKLQMQQHAELLMSEVKGEMEEFLAGTYRDQFYRTAFEVMKGTEVGSSLGKLDKRKVSQVLRRPWAQDGKAFSDRIWSDKDRLVRELHKELSVSIIRGDTPKKAIDRLAHSLKVSQGQARRLVMTESAAISASAQENCFKELGVQEFEVIETLDGRTCEICQPMDGKHFPLSDYRIGETAPPFHPNCRGCTCPYFDDEFSKGERAARGENGKTYYVPADMTYEQWKQAFVEGDETGLQEMSADDIINVEKEPSEALKQIREACAANNVEYRAVQKLPKQLSDGEIIERIAGGDMTEGSCSSLALAYIGNKNGLDVLDFRGGESRYVFSMTTNIKKMLELPGVNGSITMVKKEISGTIDVLKTLELNKEYYLATGKHAAIVRRLESGLEYLELQSNCQNGWMPFKQYGTIGTTLNKRFGCRKTVDRSFGRVWEKSVVLMEVESFKDNEEFEQILGYINTAISAQKKGEMGNVR